ncbi:MAG: nucleotidyl transferase AbiEii/AbiGii toxin family protein [Deltaproteobacteria bacterium]|nr:nucleotidyl transferase AbiEii/AbiGii toxin family protein [Deltaproteobacteria bacterium]
MIPKAHIVAWRSTAPWASDAQTEQDLIMSRALVAIFQDPFLSKSLAFRGGTALHKLYLNLPRRYSDDIDLVQIKPGGIGPIIDKVQEILNSLLGKPRRKQTGEAVTLTYRMESEGPPVVSLRMKVEINTREHFAVDDFRKHPFSVDSRWFQGSCRITTYTLEELLGTKVRALYQRRKGRDLLDLWLGLTEGKANATRIVEIFHGYMKSEGRIVDGRLYEKNLRDKMKHRGFISDIEPLLPADVNYDIQEAFDLVNREIVSKMEMASSAGLRQKAQ